jgi:hypothetical protein
VIKKILHDPILLFLTFAIVCCASAIIFFALPKGAGVFKRHGTGNDLTWDDLAQLDLRGGKAPVGLQAFNGKRVRVPGFIVPLEDSQGATSEFLLVPDPQSCIHMPPPPPNQIVYVKMVADKTILNQWLPVWVTGTFHIDDQKQKYGTASFKMDGESSELWMPPPDSK